MSDKSTRDVLLGGIKVADFPHGLIGPICARILTDVGVEVIKLESAPSGDVARGMFLVKENLSANCSSEIRGKGLRA